MIHGLISRIAGNRRLLGILFLATMLILLPIYYILFQTEAFGLFHDDGLYIVTAQSLALDGTYTIPSLPDPILQTKYPILYPAILALIIKTKPAIPDNIWLLKLPSVLFAAAWLILTYKVLASRYSPLISFIVVAFLASSQWCIYLSTSVLPDVPFSFFCFACLAFIDSADESSNGHLRVLAAALLAGAAFLTSTKGITVIFAGIAFLFFTQKWKRGFLFGGVTSIVCLPWLVWQRSIDVPSSPVLQYYSKASYAAGHIFAGMSIPQAVDVIIQNILWTAAGFVNFVGIDLMPGIMEYSLLVILGTLAISGFLVSVRLRITAMDFWIVLYTGMLLCWVWPPARYQLPVFPIFFGYVACGLNHLFNLKKGIMKLGWVAACLTVTCLGLTLVKDYQKASVVMEKDSSSFFASNALDDDWQSYKELCSWIRQHTPSDAIISANLDPVVYLLTNRKSVRLFSNEPFLLSYSSDKSRKPLGNAEALRDHILRQGITHVLLSPMTNFSEAPYIFPLFRDLIDRYPGCSRLIKVGKDPIAQIWEIDRTKLTTEPNRPQR